MHVPTGRDRLSGLGIGTAAKTTSGQYPRSSSDLNSTNKHQNLILTSQQKVVVCGGDGMTRAKARTKVRQWQKHAYQRLGAHSGIAGALFQHGYLEVCAKMGTECAVLKKCDEARGRH